MTRRREVPGPTEDTVTNVMKSYFLVSADGVERLGPDRDEVNELREAGHTLYGCRANLDLLLDVQRMVTGLYGSLPNSTRGAPCSPN